MMLSRLFTFVALAAIGLSSADCRADSVAAAQSDAATGAPAGVLSRTNAFRSQHPDWKNRQPFKGVLEALNQANARGWTVVSIKDDWRTVFPR